MSREEQIQRYLEGTLSADESRALLEALKSDPAFGKEFVETLSDASLLAEISQQELIARGIDQDQQDPRTKPQRPSAKKTKGSRSRRKPLLIAILAATAAIACVCFIVHRLHNSPPANPEQIALRVTGQAYVRDGSIERELAEGDKILGDEKIRTASNSGITVQCADGSIIELHSSTKISMDLGGSPAKKVLVSSGRVSFDIPPQGTAFIVDTPHSRTTVLGTVFTIEVTEESTSLAMEEGSVEFRDHAAGTVRTVRAGETAAADLGTFILVGDNGTSKPQLSSFDNGATVQLNDLGCERYMMQIRTPDAVEGATLQMTHTTPIGRTWNVSSKLVVGGTTTAFRESMRLFPGTYTAQITSTNKQPVVVYKLHVECDPPSRKRLIQGVTAIDCNTNLPVDRHDPLRNDTTIMRSAFPGDSLTLRVNTTGPVTAVRMDLMRETPRGYQSTLKRQESHAPFYLFGDRDGTPFRREEGETETGTHVLFVTAVSEEGSYTFAIRYALE